MRLSFFAAGILSAGRRCRGNLIVLAFAALIAGAGALLWLAGTTTTGAVQNPSLTLDMLTAGNTYDETTNTMTVGSIENCLTSEVANANQHNHTAHMAVHNVEDLVGWQARMNYLGDQMRPATINFLPFVDNTTGQNISFVNLPIDQTSSVHRDIVGATDIPTAAPGPQSALIGSVYVGENQAGVSPDTPAKPVPDDSTYSAPTGGVVAAVNLQVAAGNAGNPSLFMNLDDGTPNSPPSLVVVFDGAGLQTINLSVSQLGDGYHGEGATCVPLDCVNPECPAEATPTPSQTPAGTPTRTATATASPEPVTPSPSPSPTPSPTPNEAGHDARLNRISGLPKTVRLSQGEVITDTASVVVANDSAHQDTIGVYVDVGTSNTGGCTPSGRVLQTTITLAAGAKTTIDIPVSYSCANVAAANGMVYNWTAVADHGGDDLAACGTGALQSMGCFTALADDDADDGDNRVSRNAPRVVAE